MAQSPPGKSVLPTLPRNNVSPTKRWLSISRQVGHLPHGLELTPSSQLTDLAKILAIVVLPTPLVPEGLAGEPEVCPRLRRRAAAAQLKANVPLKTLV